MNQLIKTTIIIGTTTIALCSLTSSAIAEQRWSGTGEIIEGLGEGASVELKVKITGNTVIIQSPPSPGEQVNLNQTTTTDIGTWEVYNCNSNICATLKQNQPERTIYYRLYQQ